MSVVGDSALAITLDGRVFRLAIETGEITGKGRTPILGAYTVGRDAVSFATPFVLSEFSLRDFAEMERIEYRREVEPLYRGAGPSVNGVCVTSEAAIWTTMDGALMAVSRTDAPGRRRVWREELARAIVAISDAPVAGAEHFYYTKKSPDSMELLCFGGLAGS